MNKGILTSGRVFVSSHTCMSPFPKEGQRLGRQDKAGQCGKTKVPGFPSVLGNMAQPWAAHLSSVLLLYPSSLGGCLPRFILVLEGEIESQTGQGNFSNFSARTDL